MIIHASELLRETLQNHIDNWEAESDILTSKAEGIEDEESNQYHAIWNEIEALDSIISKTKAFLKTI